MGGLSVQQVRLLDIYILGPFLVLAGVADRLPSWARLMLVAAGVLTMAYNGARYESVEGRL